MKPLTRTKTTSLRRVIAAALLTVSASVSFWGQPAVAEEGGASNVVVVTNRLDGALRTRANASVAHDPGPTVTNSNVALARSTCTDCRTVAVAVQVILIEGEVTDFRPGNAAVAANAGCLRCETFAFARQEVLQPGVPVAISPDAAAQIAGIQGQLRAVAASDLSFDVMALELDSLTDQLVAILQGEVAQAGTSASTTSARQVEEDED